MSYGLILLLATLVPTLWVSIGFGISVAMTRHNSVHGGSVADALFWAVGWPIAFPAVMIRRHRYSQLMSKHGR